jgi:hypothetical protein
MAHQIRRSNIGGEHLLTPLLGASKQVSQFDLKAAQGGQALRSGLDDLVFVLEDFLALYGRKDADGFAHAPAGRAEDFHTVDAGHQQGYAAIPHNAHTFRKAIEGFELETGQVDALELGGWVHWRLSNFVIW